MLQKVKYRKNNGKWTEGLVIVDPSKICANPTCNKVIYKQSQNNTRYCSRKCHSETMKGIPRNQRKKQEETITGLQTL